MREHFGREPDIDRRSLIIWMPISLAVAALLLWLGFDLPPFGKASSIQGLSGAPTIGAMAFGYLLCWAAFAYAIAISKPHDTSTYQLLGLSLILPVATVVVMDHRMIIGALLLAACWLVALVLTALRLAKREPLAGLMFLPLIGTAVASLLFSLTYWAIG